MMNLPSFASSIRLVGQMLLWGGWLVPALLAWQRLLDYLEKVIPASGFLVEDRFTLADISVASPLATMGYARCPVDAARHPKVAAYLDAVLARPSFQGFLAKEQAMLKALGA